MKSCPVVLVFLGNDPPAHSLDWNDHFSDPQAAKTIPKLDETNRRRLELKASGSTAFDISCILCGNNKNKI